nr:hypothetical protein [Tanacetum cinerariifolium]
SRLDIMFVICACAKFQVTPKVSHLHVVKRIFRYLKGLPKLGLWYPRDSPFYLEAFSDSDYVGASLDRKSTTGEYVATANCCGQATAKSKTVNDVKQIHATVDGKTMVISESSVRTDLHFNNEDDAQARFKSASKRSHDPPLLEVNTSRSGEDNMEHQDDLTDFVPPTPYNSPLSGGHTPGSNEDFSRLGDQKAAKESQKIRKEAEGKNSRDESLQDWHLQETEFG